METQKKKQVGFIMILIATILIIISQAVDIPYHVRVFQKNPFAGTMFDLSGQGGEWVNETRYANDYVLYGGLGCLLIGGIILIIAFTKKK
jgi:hypothetical protein